MRIKPCKDLDLIQELDRACFPIDKKLEDEHLEESHWWVVGEGAGYVGLWAPSATEGVLVRYGVDERHQNQGLGRRLVRHSLRAARRMGLERVQTYVLAHNVESMRCLLRCGFLPYKQPDRSAIHLEVQL